MQGRISTLQIRSLKPRKPALSEVEGRRKNTAHGRKPWVEMGNDTALKGRKNA
jgi:hypothetical protein